MNTPTMWWRSPEYSALVGEALAHINEARDRSTGGTDRCRLYFLALNKLWNGLAEQSGQPERADTPSFIALVQTMTDAARDDLLSGAALAAVNALVPQVLDHFVLKRRGYRPGSPLADSVKAEATEKHRKLRNSLERWRVERRESDGVLKRLAELLFVIRSNIQHGEKTPYGPDLEKARRDEEVSSLTLPLLEAIVDGLLDGPAGKLVAYGTLKPGEPNAAILAAVGGTWTRCILRGRLDVEDGLPAFRWDPRGAEIDAMLLDAPALVKQWPKIDAFEGAAYRRHLITLTVAGALVVANCYEAAAERRG